MIPHDSSRFNPYTGLQLTFEDLDRLSARPIYFNYFDIKIYVIGCGGTGSFLVPHLARIANWLALSGKTIDLTLVDFDSVEQHNLLRQNFCRAELGMNKAQSLAIRYKAMYPNLRIGVIEGGVGTINFETNRPVVVIGCVDNPHARDKITQLFTERNGWGCSPCWWIDCGNGFNFGQVAIGNSSSLDLEDYVLEPATCITLPLPSIQYPDLLNSNQEQEANLSCAEQNDLNGQSLIINSHMAVVAGEMVSQLLNSRLRRFQVEVDTLRGSVKSKWITQHNIDQIIKSARENI